VRCVLEELLWRFDGLADTGRDVCWLRHMLTCCFLLWGTGGGGAESGNGRESSFCPLYRQDEPQQENVNKNSVLRECFRDPIRSVVENARRVRI
jgi:hypothetical protein